MEELRKREGNNLLTLFSPQQPATPGWRPPEAREDEDGGIKVAGLTPLCDVWAFGLIAAVTLYSKPKNAKVDPEMSKVFFFFFFILPLDFFSSLTPF